MRKILIMVGVLFLATSAYAKDQHVILSGKSLTAQDIEDLKEAKQLLKEVDAEPLSKAISKIEKTEYPQMTIQMRQAMALTYVDIVKELKVEGQSKREWLYSMVTLNMAYLQFGGGQDNSPQAKSLNKLILRKLKKYLPSDILSQPGFQTSLG